jgi:glutamate-1-semialdehyde 2,1-aminomutase
MDLYEFKKSYEMFAEAQQVVPGGINFPRTPLFLTYGEHPVFIQRAQGARLWDVDGNEFIDYMCAFGAVLLGYNHPGIEEARNRQAAMVNSATMPSNLWLELARFLVREIPMADWAVYGKNGSDAVTFAAMAARVHTGRPGIAMAHHAYHGLHNWCIESDAGIPAEYKTHVHRFNYNDVEDLEELIKNQRDELAAVMLTPVGHWAMRDQEAPAPGFFEAVRRLCDQNGLVFIMDDIRCGFRYRYEGTHAYYGKAEPDLCCFGKCITNGHPLAVCLGKKHIMDAAKKVYWSGTYFYEAAPMAAAMACMKEIKQSGAIEKIAALGSRFQQGLRDQAAARGIKVSVTGHPSMPYMTFAEDPSLEKSRFFCGAASRRGIFLHPHHNWFVSAALSDQDLARTLEVTDVCFKLVKEKFG